MPIENLLKFYNYLDQQEAEKQKFVVTHKSPSGNIKINIHEEKFMVNDSLIYYFNQIKDYHVEFIYSETLKSDESPFPLNIFDFSDNNYSYSYTEKLLGARIAIVVNSYYISHLYTDGNKFNHLPIFGAKKKSFNHLNLL